jgi:hypothetical protein
LRDKALLLKNSLSRGKEDLNFAFANDFLNKSKPKAFMGNEIKAIIFTIRAVTLWVN